MLITDYDLRGVLGKDLTFDLIEKVVKKFFDYLEKNNFKKRKILLAVDAKKRNFKIVHFLVQKFNFEFLGLLPTPIFYYQVISRKTPGVMITASHLPSKYSGLKFLLADGNSWKPKKIKLNLKKFSEKTPKISFNSTNYDFTIKKEIFASYFENLYKIIKPSNKIYVNFDLKNFFLRSSLPYFQKLKIFHSENSEIKIKSDLDNDRLKFVYKNKTVPLDIIFYFIALNKKYKKLGVPIYFSQHLKKKLIEKGKKIYVITTGHYFFKKAYRKKKIDFAFEPSGHFYFFKDFKTEAPYLALGIFLSFLSSKENFELFKETLSKVSIYRFDINIDQKETFSIEKIVSFLMKEFDLKLLKRFDGFLLESRNFFLHLRKSKTESKIRFTLEGEKKYFSLVKEKLKNIL